MDGLLMYMIRKLEKIIDQNYMKFLKHLGRLKEINIHWIIAGWKHLSSCQQ